MMDKTWVETYRKEIEEFKQHITAFDQGQLDRKGYKGKSGGMGSYAQKDPTLHMVRLRMAGGDLTLPRLELLAKVEQEYGIKRMKLTTCQSVQLHDVPASQVPAIMEDAIDADIFGKGGGGDNPRNVMASPLSGLQEGECFDVLPWAEGATRYLLSIAREIKMPRKLKVAFSNGADDCVHAQFRDMGFIAQPDGTFDLYVAGGLGAARPSMGVKVASHLDPSKICYYIRAMVDLFCQYGDYTNRAKARTRFMQDVLGEALPQEFQKALDARMAQGGLDLTVEEKVYPQGGEGTLDHPRAIPQKQKGLYAVKYHPIGGMLPPDLPAKLLPLLAQAPGTGCRVAPDETLYLVNLPADLAKQVIEATPDSAASDFEYSLACIGASTCQQGLRDSQKALADCVAAVRQAGLPANALPKISISGCPSSCTGHQSAVMGFQGFVKPVDGKPQPGFKMFLGGSDALGSAAFGQGGAVILESQLPQFFVEMGQAVAASGLSWAGWMAQRPQEFDALMKKFG